MMNNMMGNMNNMMNNFNNLNNLINANNNPLIEPIPLVEPTNMNMEQSSIYPKSFYVIFNESHLDPEKKNDIYVSVKENEKISDIIQKYRQKSSNFENNLKFIFNARKLNPCLTASEAGLMNKSLIFVVREKI